MPGCCRRSSARLHQRRGECRCTARQPHGCGTRVVPLEADIGETDSDSSWTLNSSGNGCLHRSLATNRDCTFGPSDARRQLITRTRQQTGEGMTQQKVSGAQRKTAPWVKSTLMKNPSGQSVAGAGYHPSMLVRAYDALAEKVDRRFGWDRLPVPLGLAVLGGLRNKLRRENLYDTSALPT